MNTYSYDGPVMEFDRCIAHRWQGITHAESENKARNNLTYQVKKACNKAPGSRISLPGKIVMIN